MIPVQILKEKYAATYDQNDNMELIAKIKEKVFAKSTTQINDNSITTKIRSSIPQYECKYFINELKVIHKQLEKYFP